MKPAPERIARRSREQRVADRPSRSSAHLLRKASFLPPKLLRPSCAPRIVAVLSPIPACSTRVHERTPEWQANPVARPSHRCPLHPTLSRPRRSASSESSSPRVRTSSTRKRGPAPFQPRSGSRRVSESARTDGSTWSGCSPSRGACSCSRSPSRTVCAESPRSRASQVVALHQEISRRRIADR